ncbi:MAG TPA: hypothetical protein VKR30_02685 [Candidatus Limnocylindrales bacterium]|nr:hypothetical protein [Candidatus Limnocylindrales bacterium]
MDPSTGELVPGSEPDVRPNEAATAAPTTAPSPAAPAPTPASAEDPSAGEATKFEEDVIGQVISLYAVLRDPAPDFELAAAKFKPIGQSLFDLQMKYEATNPDLANLIMAVRGWMSRPYDAILARTGGLKPMRDSDIAARVSDLIPDLRAIGDRLR